MGHHHHKMQLDILMRGLSLLKKGGRLVYSTCSFNPIENEAVVQAALTQLNGKVCLVDVSKEISPYLRYRKGMVAWKVFHRGKGGRDPPVWYSDWRSVPDHKKHSGNKDSAKLIESMFSDVYTKANNVKGAKQEDPLNLKRCLRLYPHDDNQGGFFCAVFEKTESWGSDV
jgi:16S rRNA C967 or C1407 C5-methylase (RsmB/RsmF family)